jgi:hypothetical protein
MGEELLRRFSDHHKRLSSSAQLLNAQLSKQKELTNEMITCSKSIIAEMRHLSLVRATLMRNRRRTAQSIVTSQPYNGLRFSPLEYCPDCMDANQINQYGFFTSFIRRNSDVFAELLFYYSCTHPQKCMRMASSVLLAICQQGWCIEEDDLLFQTLSHLADLQFKATNKSSDQYVMPRAPRKLGLPPSSIEVAVDRYQPFITFSTAYLFNGASLAFLQCALSPIILKLHSLSNLCGLRATFQKIEVDGQVVIGIIDYWREIVKHAKLVINSLTTCVDLLPAGACLLMTYLQSKKVDLYIVFFESFINRALDNPAVLGILPWNPSHADWNPSKDIADVLRTKSLHSLISKSLGGLHQLLAVIPEYASVDIYAPLRKLFDHPPPPNAFMISEAELLLTNPSFPKELLVSGTDLFLLHEAALTLPAQSEAFAQIVESLGNLPERAPALSQHFRIVITRSRMKKAGRASVVSLFSIRPTELPVTGADPYAGLFCDIVSSLPGPDSLNAGSVFEFVDRLAMVAPFFLDEKKVAQAEPVLWYARYIVGSEERLVERVGAVVNDREVWTMEATDKTCSLRAQRQTLSSALEIIRTTRANLQSHLNLELAEVFAKEELAPAIRDAMFHGDEFVTNVELFQKVALSLINTAKTLVANLVSRRDCSQICRVLFFKLTSHVTFGRYLLCDQTVWKHSVIISSIVEKNRSEILSELASVQLESFASKRSYLQRASDLIGHIRNNSGLSVILYYVLEAVNLVHAVCSQRRELNFEDCLLWVLVSAKMKHVFPISHYIQHFVINRGQMIDTLFDREEITALGVFPSAMMLLLNSCKKYDRRVVDQWAYVTGSQEELTLEPTRRGTRSPDGAQPRRVPSVILK